MELNLITMEDRRTRGDITCKIFKEIDRVDRNRLFEAINKLRGWRDTAGS